MQQLLSHRNLRVVVTIMLGLYMVSKGITPTEAGSMASKERWVFTTKAHFSFYGLLALAPIFRDQIGSVLLDQKRVYLAVTLSRSGVLFPPANSIQFMALDRSRGNVLWEKRLAVKGFPAGSRFVQIGGLLICAIYDQQKRELVILAMSPADGTILWQTRLPGYNERWTYGDILEVDPTRGLVTVYIPETKQRNRVVLRATDGQRLAETSYNGYFWPIGSRRAKDWIFGFDGKPEPLAEYHRLLAFHERNGQLAWILPLSRLAASPPTFVEDSLLITREDRLLRIDLLTGKERWAVNLKGWIAPTPDPPLVIGPKIAVAHTATPNREDNQWKLSIWRLADGRQEAEVVLHQGEMEKYSVLRPMGELVIVTSGSVLQVVDPQNVKVSATVDFGKLLPFLVYTEPGVRIADSDAHGFIVITTDGKLRYFAAEDFRQSAGMLDIPLQESQTEDRPGIFLSILFYLVVNPLWDLMLANRLTFWAMFYGFPFLVPALVWAWKPLWTWLRLKGIARGGKWGGWIGVVLSLPAAIYRGLLGGIAAGFGSYGSFGPIWGGISGFGTFLIVGLIIGITVGVLCSRLLHLARSNRQSKASS